MVWECVYGRVSAPGIYRKNCTSKEQKTIIKISELSFLKLSRLADDTYDVICKSLTARLEMKNGLEMYTKSDNSYHEIVFYSSVK